MTLVAHSCLSLDGTLRGCLGGRHVVRGRWGIASSAAVQAKLIDDLLDVSMIMTGKFAITEAPVDFSPSPSRRGGSASPRS